MELKGLKALKKLNLSKTKVSDAGMKYLEKLGELQTVDLDETSVTETARDELNQKLEKRPKSP